MQTFRVVYTAPTKGHAREQVLIAPTWNDILQFCVAVRPTVGPMEVDVLEPTGTSTDGVVYCEWRTIHLVP